MIRLELEELLEAGFYSLRILKATFSDRIYGEDIKMASSIDDVTGKATVEDVEEEASEKKGTDALIFRIFGVREKLSEHQQEVYGGTIPFFKRTAQIGKFRLIYAAETAEQLEEYAPMADQLISKGKVNNQYVMIECEGTPLIFLTIGKKISYGDTLEGAGEDVLGIFPEEVRANLPILRALHDKPFDPMQTYKAIMDFLFE